MAVWPESVILKRMSNISGELIPDLCSLVFKMLFNSNVKNII